MASFRGVAGNDEQRGGGMRENELIIATRVRLDLCGMRSRDAAVAVKLSSAVGHSQGWRIQVGSFEEEKLAGARPRVQVHTHGAGGGGVLINDHYIYRTSCSAGGGIGADVSRGLRFGRQQMLAGSAVSEQVHGVVERPSNVFVLLAGPTVGVNRIV